MYLRVWWVAIWTLIESDSILQGIVNSVQLIMKSTRKLKIYALLRNITDLRPILNNETRWFGKLSMLERFLKIRDELLRIRISPDGHVEVDQSEVFYDEE